MHYDTVLVQAKNLLALASDNPLGRVLSDLVCLAVIILNQTLMKEGAAGMLHLYAHSLSAAVSRDPGLALTAN